MEQGDSGLGRPEPADQSPDLVLPDLRMLRTDTLLRELVDRAGLLIENEDRVHRLLDAVVSVGSNLALPEVLDRIVHAACDLVTARYGALGVIGPERTLVEFRNAGVTDDERAAIGHLPTGKGILGLLINDPAPIRLHDVAEHPASFGFPPNHPPMRSFLGVPIWVRGKAFGNLYLTEKQGGGDFTAEDQQLVIALAGRDHELTVDVVSGPVSPAIQGSRIPTDGNRIGEVLRTGEACVVIGDLTSIGLPDEARNGDPLEEPDPSSLLLVPLSAGTQRLGVLTVVRSESQQAFDSADMRMLMTFAGHATLALEYARAQADQQRLAIYEDRDRIARDLHDLVIQQLFAIGLGIQGSVRQIANPNVSARIGGYVRELDQTIQNIRRTIFSLQDDQDQAPSVRRRVIEIIEDISGLLGFAPHLALTGPIDTVVAESLATELLSTMREALTNVARHAHASEVTARIHVDIPGRTLELVVLDNGVGVPDPVTRQSGLANMADRASRLGGSFSVGRQESGGTIVTWKVPIEL